MSNIRSIVEGCIPAEYRTQAQPVVEQVVAALEEGLGQSLNVLATSAKAAGVSEAQFTEALISAGLAQRAPEPTHRESDLLGEIAHLTNVVNRILRAAEARGISI